MPLTAPRYTVDDLEQFPDDGSRYELLHGVLLVNPAPRLAHKGVAFRLTLLLGQVVQVPGLAQVTTPGIVVSLPLTQLEPDILVFPTRFSLGSTWADISEHWLAVEVLSRSSRVYDREFKRDAYFALGVQEVWLVDIGNRCVEVSRERGKSVVVRDKLVWQTPVGVPVVVKLADLFAGVG